jgi:UDP-N-acetylglucosamine transferase subunit ALG13
MIFVTVGTTLPFDGLLSEVDRLAATGIFQEKVVCQTGTSRYLPKHCEHFQYKTTIADHINAASFLIVHGGTGSTLQALRSGRPFAVFANPIAQNNHQVEFLQELSHEIPIPWSDDVHDLEQLYGRISNEPAQLATPRHRDSLQGAILRIIRNLD